MMMVGFRLTLEGGIDIVLRYYNIINVNTFRAKWLLVVVLKAFTNYTSLQSPLCDADKHKNALIPQGETFPVGSLERRWRLRSPSAPPRGIFG